MRYDDFSNEDVGNIIMDTEPDIRRTLKETIQEANSFEGVSEFDERGPGNLRTTENRPLFMLGPRFRSMPEPRLGKYNFMFAK